MAQLPPEVQRLLVDYQNLQEQYVRLDSELKVLRRELSEIEDVITTLKTLPEDTDVYKSVGHILVKRRREDVLKELEERKELLDIKIKSKENQLKLLEKQLREKEAIIKKYLPPQRG